MRPTAKRALMTHMTDRERREREKREKMNMRYPDWRPEMRSAPYRGGGGYNDRAGSMTYGGYMGSDGGYSRAMEPDMTGPYYGYEDDAEMRRSRDSRGRYTSVRSEYEEPEMARRRRSDGTYMSMGGYDEPEMTGSRYLPPYGVPPVYERKREEAMPKMNKIGFTLEGEMERLPEVRHDYMADGTYRTGDEMAHKTSMEQKGYGMGDEVMPMTKETATEWMKGLENADGSKAPHWSMDQAKTVMGQKNISGIPVLDFYVVLNSIYSDYCAVAKKLGVNNVDFYVCMAKAFIEDPDAVDNKVEAYYNHIVKH